MTDPTTAMRAAREALADLLDTGFTRGPQGKRAQSAIAQLDAALAQPSDEARDAVRLDAIERNLWFVEPQYQNDPATWRVGKARGSAHAKTLREAIDAALQAKDGAR